MPLVGIVDPSHSELKLDEPGRNPNWFPIDELLQRSAAGGPKWSPYPYEVLAGMLGEHQERDYISTTMICSGCPRSAVLERREDYIEAVPRFYAPFRGTMIHSILEGGARPGSAAEFRFHTTVEGIPFSCSPDLITANGDMYDYKLTENPPTFEYPWKGHTKQVQWNRFVVNNAESWTLKGESAALPFDPNTLEFESLSLVYLGPKGPKVIMSTQTKEVRTPNNKWVKRKMPRIDTDEQVLEEMLPPLLMMQKALDMYPEFPIEAAELWGGPPTWACPGKPWCSLPDCLAKRYPHGLMWDPPVE